MKRLNSFYSFLIITFIFSSGNLFLSAENHVNSIFLDEALEAAVKKTGFYLQGFNPKRS